MTSYFSPGATTPLLPQYTPDLPISTSMASSSRSPDLTASRIPPPIFVSPSRSPSAVSPARSSITTSTDTTTNRSTYSPSRRPVPTSSTLTFRHVAPPTPLSALSRKASHLQTTLQTLLDAQSDGLLAGLGNAPPSSSGSQTPTASTSSPPPSITASSAGSGARKLRQSALITPVRQPPARKKLGLRGARRGILKTMQELAGVKATEGKILEDEAAGNKEVLERLDGWAAKQEGLEAQISTAEANVALTPEGEALAQLKSEEGAVTREIKELEVRLQGLRNKQGMLRQRVQEAESVIQARVSSYQRALELVQGEVAAFLRRPPLGQTLGRDGGENFLSLPVKRRTLEMAREEWGRDGEVLAGWRAEVRRELEALERGGDAWEEVVRDVVYFEDRLRLEMRRQARTGPAASMLGDNQVGELGDVEDVPEAEGEGLTGLLLDMDRTMASLEKRLRLAKQNNWNLLVCCIGAEYEAFKQGRELLRMTLGLGHEALEEEEGEEDLIRGHEQEQGNAGIQRRDWRDPLDPLGSQRGDPPLVDVPRLERHSTSESSNEDPGPELLVAHQDEE